MSRWAAVVLGLRDAADDNLRSRLPTYAHLVAGRALAWHVLHAVSVTEPAPEQLLLVTGSAMNPALLGDLPADLVLAQRGDWWTPIERRLGSWADRILIADACAPTLGITLTRVITADVDRVVRSEEGTSMAVWLTGKTAAARAGGGKPIWLMADDCEEVLPEPGEEFLVRDRAGLARAARIIRDRVVRKWMEAGVTFLAPETVHLDVDVEIGADTIIYPGVVLEGQTRIGSEAIIGPGCRLVDSKIGSKAELKGGNFLYGCSVHERAVLEPCAGPGGA